MIVLGQLSQSGDQTMRAAASTASQYYFGRIDGRVADAELEAAIWRETRGMRADEQAAAGPGLRRLHAARAASGWSRSATGSARAKASRPGAEIMATGT